MDDNAELLKTILTTLDTLLIEAQDLKSEVIGIDVDMQYLKCDIKDIKDIVLRSRSSVFNSAINSSNIGRELEDISYKISRMDSTISSIRYR